MGPALMEEGEEEGGEKPDVEFPQVLASYCIIMSTQGGGGGDFACTKFKTDETIILCSLLQVYIVYI